MARLQVNIDHVATVRQARRTVEPDPVHAAVLAELAGATGITVHLREDRRHIQDRDVEILRRTVRTRLNLEMAASDEMVAIARRIRPDMCTLVPERREELTTEGGLDVVTHREAVARAVRALAADGIEVSLFVDARVPQLDVAKLVGAHAVELHTGTYAHATGAALEREIELLRAGAARAQAQGLVVHAGHGLTYWNTAAVAAISAMCDLNIGHSIVSRAVLVGMERAVREMIAIIDAATVGGRGAPLPMA
ncbi:MAG: pyridoxine 5'-phosphate synthase [Planctomycetes bacterium]|nr:pyridoxine 5'-phosphate synthase [Planctomycetota bacterium]MCC7169095.1 pyridoxine 5'-phosphate synthase [Planctomycetota bacterium]